MGLVRIVTDGGADLPPDLADSLGIAIVRGSVHFGSETWTGSADEFWETVRRSEVPPSTAPPSVDALRDAFAIEDPVCAICVSAELSRTEDHAKLAATE